MGKKILIIDDEYDARVFCSTVVENLGHQALTAENGEEGIAKIRGEKPQLIILDILMPRESGIRMYREVKTDPQLKNIPIIILSGIAKKTFLRSLSALEEFASGPLPESEAYFEKPIEPQELEAVIKNLLQ